MKKYHFGLPLFLFAVACNEPTQETSSSVNEEARQQRLALEEQYNVGSGALINVTDIVGKNLQAVEKELGKAESIEKSKPSGTPCKTNGGCDKAFFRGGKYEILFINKKADWITINGMSDFDLNEGSIKLIGLPVSQPTFNNPSSVLRWEDVKGIREISFFNNGSDKIDYIYIKAKTK